MGAFGTWLAQFAGGVVIICWVGNRPGVVLEILGTIIRYVDLGVLLYVFPPTVLELAERVVVG